MQRIPPRKCKRIDTPFERLEPRTLFAGVVINEFLASNSTGIIDQDGDHSDWIELHNTDPAPVNLNGWYLTDDSANLTKWKIPSTNVATGGYLTIFASGKDRHVSGQELHTNFELNAAGEYLALVMPNGTTIAQEFAPFPEQHENVSYGLGQVSSDLALVSPGATATTIVPTNSSLDAVWNTPGYSPDASWTTGSTGVGYGQTFNGFLVKEYQANTSASSPIGTTLDSISEVVLLIDTPAAYTSVTAGNYSTINFRNNYSGAGNATRFTTGQVEFPGQTTGTDYNNVATEAHALITIPTAGAWTFGLDHNEGYLLRIDEQEFTQDGTGSTEKFHTIIFDQPGTYDLDLYHFERTGSSWLKLYAAPGTLTSFSSAFHLVGDTANGGLAVKSDIVGSNGASITSLLGTNLQAQMQGINPGFFTRIAFNVADPSAIDFLKLRMKYDDGFVAYINGTEIARRNISGTAFNSTATMARTNTNDVTTYEDIDVSAFTSALVAGQNVLAIHDENITAGDPDALIMPELIGTDDLAGTAGYFQTPTPGAANSAASLGFVADTQFSAQRGFFNAPFQLSITSATPGAQIYYTTNGDAPTQGAGTLYTGPITINKTTALRAVAFKDGYIPTNTDTQTYLFLNDIVQQTAAKTVQLGFPTTWGTSVPNSSFPASVFPDGAGYGLDPDIVGNFDANGNPIGGDLYGGVYAAGLKDALTSIPTISIVADMDDLFSTATGIISNASSRGVAWERAASIEWITPDGAPEFQVDAGLRIQGAFFRSNSNNLKKSFQIQFKNIYGAGRLDFPLFGDTGGAVTSFNGFVLRGGGNDGYSWTSARLTEQFTRDEFMRDLQVASGNVGPHGNFAHLYINGVYWGLYNPVEHPDGEFAASYLGGDPNNYDVMHRGGGTFEEQEGDRTKWDEMMAVALQATSSNVTTRDTAYMQLQGKKLDGTPDPAHPPLIDLKSYVDYIIVNAWGGNWDWPRNNFWAARDRDPLTTTGFHFFNWDGENTLGNNLSRSPLNADDFNASTLPGSTFGQDGSSSPLDNAGRIHSLLKNNAEYRQLFADEVQKFFFNDGILTPQSLIARFQAISDYVDEAVIGESARWGDMHAHQFSSPNTNVALTPQDWVTERNWILGTYLPQRTGIVLNQWRTTYGLYPTLDAPTLSQFGGTVPSGYHLTITAPAGTIYYTLDGSDPRKFGGTVSPNALVYNPASPPVINDYTRVQARVLNGGVWSALTNTEFLVGGPPALHVSEILYHPISPAAGSPYTDADFEFIELQNLGAVAFALQDFKIGGGVTFTFPNSLPSLAPGARTVVVNNLAAFQSRYGTGITVAGEFVGDLSNSTDEIILTSPFGQPIQDFTYSADWYPVTDKEGFSLVAVDAGASNAVLSTAAGWRPSGPVGGAPGAADPGLNAGSVVVNEVYTIGTSTPATGDWVELKNTTAASIDIGKWFLSDSSSNLKKYQIPAGTIIPAGGFITLSEVANFGSAFGLSSAGESIHLSQADASGNLMGYRDGQDFGAGEAGVTFGRYLRSDGNVDFPLLALPTFGAENAPPKVGPIVINELMYNPGAGGDEFIELRNITGAPVNLYDPANPANRWQFTAGVTFTFPASISIPAGGYALVVPIDPAAFRTKYNVSASVAIFGPYTGALDDSGESVELAKPGTPSGAVPYITVDRVKYDHAAPWATAAAGTGPALARVFPDEYANDPVNWQSAAATLGAATNLTIDAPAGATNLRTDPGPGATYNLAFNVNPTAGGATLNITANALDQVHLRNLAVPIPGDSHGDGLVVIGPAAGGHANPVTGLGGAGGSVAVYLGNGAGGSGIAPRTAIEALWRSAAIEGYWALQNHVGGMTAITRGVTLATGVVTDPNRNGLVILASVDEAGHPVTYLGEDITGDTNGDAKVDINDLGAVLQHLNTAPGSEPGESSFTLYTPGEGDINGDLTVNINDLGIVLANLNQAYSPAAGGGGTAPIEAASPGGMSAILPLPASTPTGATLLAMPQAGVWQTAAYVYSGEAAAGTGSQLIDRVSSNAVVDALDSFTAALDKKKVETGFAV